MPFGYECEYKDFKDCVAKNRDKDDPEAFCATLMRKTEKQCRSHMERIDVIEEWLDGVIESEA